MSFESKDQAALELFKHYSGMRFLMLPLFFTAMGALVLSYWSVVSAEGPANSIWKLWLELGGVVLSIFFTVYEYRLSDTLMKVSQLLPEAMATLKHSQHLGPITLVTLVLYGAPSLCWLWLALSA